MTQSKAAEVYAIPTLRRHIVSYLPPSSLATVVHISRDLMRDAIIALYSEVDRKEVLDMMHSGYSSDRQQLYKATVRTLRVAHPSRCSIYTRATASIDYSYLQYPYDRYLQPAHTPLIVTSLRTDFPNVSRLYLEDKYTRVLVTLRSGADIGGAIEIATAKPAGLFADGLWCWALPPSFSCTVIFDIRFSRISVRTAVSDPRDAEVATIKAKLRSSPYSIVGLDFGFVFPGFHVISNIFDDAKGIKLSQGLALTIKKYNLLDLLARHDLIDLISIVNDSMPALRHLRLPVKLSEQDEVDCLQHLDGNDGTSRLRQLDLTGSRLPTRPMFNIMRLFAGLMDRNGTIKGIPSKATQYWQYIAKSKGDLRKALFTSDLRRLGLKDYADITKLSLDSTGRLVLRTDQHPDSGASAKASAAWSRIVPPAVAHNESRGFAQLTAPSAVSTSDKEETLRLLALAQQRFANTYGAADHDQCFEKLGAHITGSRSGDARADTIPDSGEANDQKDTVGSDSMGGEG